VHLCSIYTLVSSDYENAQHHNLVQASARGISLCLRTEISINNNNNYYKVNPKTFRVDYMNLFLSFSSVKRHLLD